MSINQIFHAAPRLLLVVSLKTIHSLFDRKKNREYNKYGIFHILYMIAVYRILISLALFVGIFVMPWWLWLILMFGVALLFSSYYEAIILSLCADLLYMNFDFSTITLIPDIPVYTLIGVGLFFIAQFLHKKFSKDRSYFV
jgi:hypothetical protein